MKILQFVHGYPPEFKGGTETYAQAVGIGLVERGHDCLVVAGSEWPCPEPSIAVREHRGVVVARLIGLPRRQGFRPSSYDPLAETLIRRILDWWRPHIVHIHHWVRLTNNLLALCREFEIPAVVTLHDQWVACSRYHRVRPDEAFCADRAAPCGSCVDRDNWQSAEEIEWDLRFRERTIERELLLAGRLLVPSKAQQAFLHTIAGVPLGRLEIVPLGSPRAVSERVGLREPHSTGSPVKVGYWGYLLPEKGVHLLLEAARKLSKGTVVEWHLFGQAFNPAYLARLAQLAEGLQVIFHGSYSFRDLQSADLDLVVFPSLSCETYSFVLDEAFALGLPVLASNRGAFCERLGDAGTLFDCGNVDDLATKLESLLQSREALRRSEQKEMRGKMVSMDDHIGRMEKIYQEVVDSYVPGVAPEQEYRELLLHQHQQLISRDRELADRDRELADRDRELADRDREIARLLKCVADLERAVADVQHQLQVTQDRLVEMAAEGARLRQIGARLEVERDWWKKQTKQLEDDFDRLKRSPLVQFYLLLSRLK